MKFVAAMLAVVWTMALAACSSQPSEVALRQTLDSLQDAIDQRDARGVEDLLAEDFIGPDGLDRAGARRLAALQWAQHTSTHVVLGALDVKTDSSHGSVRFTAALTGGSGALLPDSAQAYEVETGWRFDDGQWRMTSATWQAKF